MKPRLRLVVDNTRRPPLSEPTLPDENTEAIVARTLYLLRNDRRTIAEKEALVRAFLLSDED